MLLSRTPRLALALAGPAALGLWLAIRLDMVGFASGALGVPLVVLAVAAITAPALYIGAAVVDASPAPAVVLRGILESLDSAGLVVLGLMPAVLFLGATADGTLIPLLTGLAALGGALVFGMRLLFGRVFQDPLARARALPVFGAWAVVSLGIGALMLVRALGLDERGLG